MTTQYEYHEAANIFPMMEGDSFDELVSDVKKNGLHEDIELLDGKILDGRNRHSACTMAGIKPRFKTVTTDDPVAYVLSKNLHRRHLTPSQASMVAARARDYYDRQAKERQKRKPADSVLENLPGQKGTARDQAAKAAGVSGKTVDHATKVLKHGVPELVKAVDEGRMAVSTAAILASESPEVQRAEATAPKRNRTYKSGLGGGAKPIAKQEPEEEDRPHCSGKPPVGVILANEALNVLMRIPRNDPLRKRGFQIVVDWIRTNG
jgi:hypothetical protein